MDGVDMMIKQKYVINQHKDKIEPVTLNTFLTEQLNRVITILENINDKNLTTQIETILNNIMEHNMQNMEKIIVLLKKILSKKYNRYKSLKYLKKILKQVQDTSWNTIDVSEILMKLDEYQMPNFIATFFQPDVSLDPLDEDDYLVCNTPTSSRQAVELMDVDKMLIREYQKYNKQ